MLVIVILIARRKDSVVVTQAAVTHATPGTSLTQTPIMLRVTHALDVQAGVTGVRHAVARREARVRNVIQITGLYAEAGRCQPHVYLLAGDGDTGPPVA